jgi:hypothetical protein
LAAGRHHHFGLNSRPDVLPEVRVTPLFGVVDMNNLMVRPASLSGAQIGCSDPPNLMRLSRLAQTHEATEDGFRLCRISALPEYILDPFAA